jgi:hypothetical protein
MMVIYCCDPLKPSRVDEDFAREARVASLLGLEHSLVDYEQIVAGRMAEAVRRVRVVSQDRAVYRGWMLTAEQYAALYSALGDCGARLINDPTQYRYAHWFPESYADLAEHTPQSICIPLSELDWARLGQRLQPFGAKPLVVKDWVKSRKHEWDEACYIPSASDIAAVERVARRFIELQGDDLVGGLVFRAFEPFVPLGSHVRSGMPLTKELRLFYFDGEPMFTVQYWEDQEYGTIDAPTAIFSALARRLRSRFFTLDVALRDDGMWRVVEVGDGQVSGIPKSADVNGFYGALIRHVSKSNNRW